MAGLTNAGEAWALNYICNQSPAAAGTMYAGLLSSLTDEEDQTGAVEVSYTSYARQPITFTGTGSSRTNSGAITFPAVDVGEGPITVSGIGIFTALSGGTHVAIDDITNETLNAGGNIEIANGQLSISLD